MAFAVGFGDLPYELPESAESDRPLCAFAPRQGLEFPENSFGKLHRGLHIELLSHLGAGSRSQLARSTAPNFFDSGRPEMPLPFPWYLRRSIELDPRKGSHMQNPLVLDAEMQRALDDLGAEPLDGSGFENEPSDPEFEANEFAGEEA